MSGERDRRRRVVVIGGGITGLSCAYFLAKDSAIDVTLLESSARLGGNIRTEREHDFVIDVGPDAWIANKPEATALVRELGIGDEIIATIESNRRVYIANGSELYPMPEGLVLGIPTEVAPFLTTPLLSIEGKLRAGFDLFIPRRRFHGNEDESVGHFVSRRLGPEVTERLVGPLLGGIFAGDAYSISVRAAFPSLIEAEDKYGSLILAMRAQRRGRTVTRPQPSAFSALRGGTSRFVEVLADRARERAELRLSTPVARVRRTDSSVATHRYAVELERGEALQADDVVLAMPSRASSRLVRGLDAPLADAFDAFLAYGSVGAVFLGMPRSAVQHPLDATGFIAPRTPGRSVIAATFMTSKWEGRGPADQALFRVFLGGEAIETLVERPDDELIRIATDELRAMVPFEAAPTFARAYRHVRTSPQPLLGHFERRAKIEALLGRFPGLHTAAGGMDGAGIPDCIRQARAVATKIGAVL